MSKQYETVIGLEVHVQLATNTKIFCPCSTKFGGEPNTHVCPVCLGLPGVLPVLNKKVFEYAIKVGIALDFDLQRRVKFDRKNYYYPDLPKNYQISQFDMPIAYNGKIVITNDDGTEKIIGVTRAHMEEDAGKLLHDQDPVSSYVDLNRTGTPLLEIVSEPDMRSPEEAYKYLTVLKQIIKYLGVSDCNMEEGSLRCDANISLRKAGDTELGSKVEIKNLNSFKAVRDALAFEEERQEDVLEEGRSIPQQTRLWDESRGITSSMRTKEGSHDYRYFPDPDLVPFEVKEEEVEAIRKDMPELPAAKRERFASSYKLKDSDIELLISEVALADFFEQTVREYNEPKNVANWIQGGVMMNMNDRGVGIRELPLSPSALAEVIKLASSGTISNLAAKEVLKEHLDSGKAPRDIVKEKGLEQVSNEGELEGVVLKVIESNEKSVADYQGGKSNALGFLVGQVMKETKGKANPKLVGEMLKNKLSG